MKKCSEQEYIQVGCVLPTSVAIALGGVCLGGVCPGGCLLGSVCPEECLPRERCPPRGCLTRAVCTQGCLSRGGVRPPMDRQMPVKTLPFPKLRLRAVMRNEK